MRRDSLATLIGAIIAFLAQIIIAPNIAIFDAMPNFLLAYALVISVIRPAKNSTLVLAFVFGLLFDLLSHAPVGAMAFLFVLASYISSRLFVLFDNDSIFMFVLVFAVSVALVEVLYGVFLTVFGISSGVFQVIFMRALPCALYDFIFGLLLYLFAARFFIDTPLSAAASGAAASSAPSISFSSSTQRRSRVSKKKMPKF